VTAVNKITSIELQTVKPQVSTTQIDKAQSIIEVSSLNFSIKNKVILKDLNFTVNKGEIYALLGGNGAGKSTTLKTLLGFNKPTDGSVKVAGKEVTQALDFVRGKTA
jgi:ABC-2 type transport system ATP-binding protein